MALAFPDMNFLGLEIRRPCVEEAFKKKEKLGAQGNCHFLALNANVDLDRVVEDVQQHSEIVRCKCSKILAYPPWLKRWLFRKL